MCLIDLRTEAGSDTGLMLCIAIQTVPAVIVSLLCMIALMMHYCHVTSIASFFAVHDCIDNALLSCGADMMLHMCGCLWVHMYVNVQTLHCLAAAYCGGSSHDVIAAEQALLCM